MDIRFSGRAAWDCESDALRVTVLQCGGHIAALTLKSKGLSPLWIQSQPTIDSDTYDPALHAATYGADGESKLIAGLLGHNLCLPYWGVPSNAELSQGMTCHGEAGVVRWKTVSATSQSLELMTELPEACLKVTRALKVKGNVVHVASTVENARRMDVPVGWCEHVTVGPPFLSAEHTRFYADLGIGFRTSGDTKERWRWPHGKGAIATDLRQFSAKPHADLVNSFLVESRGEYACFAAWNAALRMMMGYVFCASEFPWMNVWEDHGLKRQTRGMEFSNTPVEGSMRALVAKPELFGVPTFDWLPAHGRLAKEFWCFVVEVAQGYAGVAAVEIDKRTVRVFEQGGGEPLRIAL